jgi:hypothetical protein
MTDLNDIAFNEIEGINTPSEEETLNNEPEIVPNPWDNAPENVYFYDKLHSDGRLGAYTESAQMAYENGWDIENNFIPISDTQQSDINGWTYRKDVCPMKTDEDKLKDQYRLEITQLKKQLSDTDYKAIKYAEGQISEEDYASVRELRQSYRDRINELEALL